MGVYCVSLWLAYGVIGPPLAFGWYLIPAAIFLLNLSLIGWGQLAQLLRIPSWMGVPLGLGLVVMAVGTPAKWESWASERTNSDKYGRRVVAYKEIADFILANGLSDMVLLTSEPGYLTYFSGNPVIDAAGLVTRNVYSHGSSGRRTSIAELIAQRKPDLLIATFPFTPKGYKPICTACLGTTLFMRTDLKPGKLSGAGKSQPGGDSDLAQGLDIDISSDSLPALREAGAWMWKVGRVVPLTLDGEKFTDEFGFLGASRAKRLEVAQTQPFLIQNSKLQMLFKGTHPQRTVVQLVVEGKVVQRQLGAEPGESEFEWQRVEWSLESWRGKRPWSNSSATAKQPGWPLTTFGPSTRWGVSRESGGVPRNLERVVYSGAFIAILS